VNQQYCSVHLCKTAGGQELAPQAYAKHAYIYFIVSVKLRTGLSQDAFSGP